jgi:predicted GTPase
MIRKNVIIMGAAGRDFHNFNVRFRDNEEIEVVAFTATQIPHIEGRIYPAELAGKLYPKGIPIHPEEELTELIKKHQVDGVIFAYSDVPHEYVMHKASMVNAAGADFWLLGATTTSIKSKVPVIAICAVRTGCGKSQTTRRVSDILKSYGKQLVAIRHPMPYGDLTAQKVQRFASYEDMDKHKCTIEEREEYEPHINQGTVVYAGIDYGAILQQAEKEADVILWDGGNNDTPFYQSDLHIVVADPHRAGHELSYYPGETNLRMADVVIINKIDTAGYDDIEYVRESIREVNPKAIIIDAASPLAVEQPDLIRGKRALVVEDGPTLTHGEMGFGAGIVAAEKFGAAEIVDPRPWIVGKIVETYEKYPDIGTLLPAMGYGEEQVADLEKTINAVDCDVVIIGTPIDLRKVVNIKKPTVRVRYELQEIGKPDLEDVLKKFKA